MALIGRGLSNREIAEALVISERTVEAHIAQIGRRLDVRSRVQIAVWAGEQGLLSPES